MLDAARYRRKDTDQFKDESVLAIKFTGDNVDNIKAFCYGANHSNDPKFEIKGPMNFSEREYRQGFFQFPFRTYGKRFLTVGYYLMYWEDQYWIQSGPRFEKMFERVT